MAVRKFTEDVSGLLRRLLAARLPLDRLGVERFVARAMILALALSVLLPKNCNFDDDGNDHAGDDEQEQTDGTNGDDGDNVFCRGSCSCTRTYTTHIALVEEVHLANVDIDRRVRECW